MVLVPLDTVTLERNLLVFGYHDHGGHAEVEYRDARVPATNLLGQEGDGFAISQARLGPGRIHHCMRTIGAAEGALEPMCLRAASRVTFGEPVRERANVRDWIADVRTLRLADGHDEVDKRVIALRELRRYEDRVVSTDGAPVAP